MASLDERVPWQDLLLELRGLRSDVRELIDLLGATGARPGDVASSAIGEDPPPMLTIIEVARLLRTTPKAVYALVQRGQLPGVQRLGRRVLVRRDVLLRSLQKRVNPRDI